LSHSKENKVDRCLNCKTKLVGNFCHACGQKSEHTKDSFWHLVFHFFHDLTHIEVKWFITLKYLITRPGFLSREYLHGRRVAYQHPIRLYVITSAFFFILFFSFFHSNNTGIGQIGFREQHIADSLYGNWNSAREFALKNANSKEDTVEIEKALKMIAKTSLGALVDSLDKAKMRSPFIYMMSTSFASKDEYYRAQQKLPIHQKDSWIEKMIIQKKIEVSQKIKEDPDGFFDFSFNILIHKVPQLLFVSLPLFALLLKFLYWRQGVYYSEHVIFSAHLYVFTFVSLFIYFTFSKLQQLYHWGWIRYALAVCILYIVFYTFMAMKSFYRQGFLKTLGKYFLLNLMSLTVMLMLFMAFFIFYVFHN